MTDKAGIDTTFLTRQQRKPTTFEVKYLERFGNNGDKRIGLPGLSPQLVDKQREMEMTNEKLEEARSKFDSWKSKFQQRKKEIEEKQQNLAEQKKKLDQFTVHHTAELDKAKKKADEELDNARRIDHELQELTIEEAQLKKQNDDLKGQLEKLQPCADYLQRVVESCQTFDNIDAILTRYHSLDYTRDEHLKRYQELIQRLGTDEGQLTKELELKKSHLIDCTMQYNKSLAKVVQARKLNEYKKTNVIKGIQRIEEKSTELAAIKTSIRNIYTRALSRDLNTTEQALKLKEDVSEEAMLTYITNRFLDLRDIINDKDVEYISPQGGEGPAHEVTRKSAAQQSSNNV